MRTILVSLFVCLSVGCADHRMAVCAEGRDETVCFDGVELATIVSLYTCVDAHEVDAPTYDDLVIKCAAHALGEHAPQSPGELWRKMVVIYSHADDAPNVDDDLNSALYYVCTADRTAFDRGVCDRWSNGDDAKSAMPDYPTLIDL